MVALATRYVLFGGIWASRREVIAQRRGTRLVSTVKHGAGLKDESHVFHGTSRNTL
jgi:hypothetical protein